MSKLRQTLRNHGIDAASVDLLVGAGKEAVYGLTTDGASAVDLWRRLRSAAGEIGYWPVILGRDEDIEQHRESCNVMSEAAGRGSVMDIVAAGAKVDIVEWLTERAALDPQGPPPLSGQWPSEEEPPSHQFTLPMNPDDDTPLPRVHIGLIPTVIGWQVPAFLRFGGWNHCPSPEHHVAMLRYWRGLYGAEIVGLGGDVLEVAISRPPTDRTAALRLAREQYVYCSDIVRLSSHTLEGRAASLLGTTVWSFWWE